MFAACSLKTRFCISIRTALYPVSTVAFRLIQTVVDFKIIIDTIKCLDNSLPQLLSEQEQLLVFISI